MTITYVDTLASSSVSAAGFSPSVPGWVEDGQLLLTLLSIGNGESLTAIPDDWFEIGTSVSPYVDWWHLYGKVADGEAGNYTWTWETAQKCRIQLVGYSGDFNKSNPIGNVSNSSYITSDTTLRAASFNVPKANSDIIFVGGVYYSSSMSFTPPSNPGSFTEDIDAGDITADLWNTFAHYNWSGNGATGNIDATMSISTGSKHAFAFNLNQMGVGVGALLGGGF